VEIYKSGDKYSGKIIWGKEILEPDGKTSKKDRKNSNAELGSRNMLNMVILSGFTYSERHVSFRNVTWPKPVFFEKYLS